MSSTFSKIIRRLHDSRFLLIPGGGDYPIAPIWIGDVTTVLRRLLALASLPRETFEACGEPVTLTELLDLFERRLGVQRRRVQLPLGPLQVAARLVRRFPWVDRLPLDALLHLGSPIGVSHRALTEHFGFTPTPMADAVPQIEDFPS